MGNYDSQAIGANMSAHASPSISILLPVYNGAEFVRSAIDSLLAQTFTDFELIVLNDGSADNSQEIIDSYSDSRIVRVCHDNMGLHRTLNKGIALAKGKYICRMDQDDISAPDRLEIQKNFLDSNSDVGLVGSTSWLVIIGETTKRVVGYAFDDYEIKWFLLFDNPMVHSSVMFKKDILELSGGYAEDRKYNYAEDYDLWSRMAIHTKIYNIDSPLVTRIEMPDGMSYANLQKQRQQAFEISARNWQLLLVDESNISDVDVAILRSIWLSMALPEGVSAAHVFKRLPSLLRASERVFESMYKNYSPKERLVAKKWIASKYQEIRGGLLATIFRTIFAISFQPGNLQRLKLTMIVGYKSVNKLLRNGLGFSR